MSLLENRTPLFFQNGSLVHCCVLPFLELPFARSIWETFPPERTRFPPGEARPLYQLHFVNVNVELGRLRFDR